MPKRPKRLWQRPVKSWHKFFSFFGLQRPKKRKKCVKIFLWKERKDIIPEKWKKTRNRWKHFQTIAHEKNGLRPFGRSSKNPNGSKMWLIVLWTVFLNRYNNENCNFYARIMGVTNYKTYYEHILDVMFSSASSCLIVYDPNNVINDDRSFIGLDLLIRNTPH